MKEIDELAAMLDELTAILDEECKILVKNGQMIQSVDSPWRYYSPPIEEESETDHLRSVIEAGRWFLAAQKDYDLNNRDRVWVGVARSQAALLKSISAKGKKEAKRIGNKKGGENKHNSNKHLILYIADKLIEDGHSFRGLAAKVANELMRISIPMSVDAVLKILNKYRDELEKISSFK